MINKIKYGESVIVYDLIQSNRRKTSQITINSDGVTVRVPNTKNISDAKEMVKQRAQWIYKKQLQFNSQKVTTFSKNSKLSYKGKEYTIKIIPQSKEKIKLVGGMIEFHIPQKRHTTSQIKSMYDSWMFSKAEIILPKIVQQISNQTKINYSKINIKSLKDRWGSATPTGDINLNSHILKAPKKVMEYVILHELCHIKIKEHSHRFWNLLSKYMPEYERHTKWLDNHGILVA
jgi:predicted metal-dependent hydrolase